MFVHMLMTGKHFSSTMYNWDKIDIFLQKLMEQLSQEIDKTKSFFF